MTWRTLSYPFFVSFCFSLCLRRCGALNLLTTLLYACFCGLYTGCIFFFKENGRLQSKHQSWDVDISRETVGRRALALTQQNKIRVKNMQRGRDCSFMVAHVSLFQTAMSQYILKENASTVILQGSAQYLPLWGRDIWYCIPLKMHRLWERRQRLKSHSGTWKFYLASRRWPVSIIIS